MTEYPHTAAAIEQRLAALVKQVTTLETVIADWVELEDGDIVEEKFHRDYRLVLFRARALTKA